MTFWYGSLSESLNPYLWLMDPDPTPVVELKFYFVKHYFSPLNTFMGKGKDPQPDPDPYLD